MIINNATIGFIAAENLKINNEVTLYARFSNSCYFQCENGEFIMLADKKYGPVSFAISVDNPLDVLNQLPEVGSELVLNVNGDIWIPTHMATIRNENPNSLTMLKQNLRSFDDIFHNKIFVLKADIIKAAKAEDYDKTISLFTGFLGLGQGLTPSADDWTFAFFYTLKCTKRKTYADKVCQALSDIAKPLTSFASYAYLSSLKTDNGIECINNLLNAYENAPSNLQVCCQVLSMVGSSSGQDMLWGIYDALLLE